MVGERNADYYFMANKDINPSLYEYYVVLGSNVNNILYIWNTQIYLVRHKFGSSSHKIFSSNTSVQLPMQHHTSSTTAAEWLNKPQEAHFHWHKKNIFGQQRAYPYADFIVVTILWENIQ